MSKDGHTLGIDFIGGYIYINGSWANNIPGFPLNAQNKPQISFDALRQPDKTGTYLYR